MKIFKFKNKNNEEMMPEISLKVKVIDVDMIYPIGSIYMSVNDVNPKELFGGTWEQLKDRFLLGAGDTYENDSIGGKTTLGYDLGVGGSPFGAANSSSYGGRLIVYGGHNSDNGALALDNSIMPPYLTVYMWKRIK